MNEIYNEGRVVGYSAEEIFNKLFRALYPNDELPTTKEWLSAGMGMGASFALHINKATDDRSIVTYTLPGSSDATNLKGLSGRYLIVATPIFGTVISSDDTKWITEFDVEDGTTAYATDVGDYSKILNGVISYSNDSATIKLLIDGTCNCNVLFTGFLNKKILKTFALSATTEAVGSAYTDIDDFGNTLTPDISQIFFARPNYREYFKANVVDTDDTHGSLIDISQVNNNSSTLSTSASIITPASTTYSNKAGKDNGNIIPNVFSVQQHTNGTQKINPALYFYNSATGKLEPIDSDAKGAVNIIKRDISTSPKETVAQLKSRLANMSAANTDKIFLGAWTDDSGKILNIWLPDGTPIVNSDAISVSAGSGISVVQTIDPNDNSVDYNISANLSAGTGITITGTADNQPKVISGYTIEGDNVGIGVRYDDITHKIVITNTMPYTATGVSYTTLTKGVHYLLEFRNNFTNTYGPNLTWDTPANSDMKVSILTNVSSSSSADIGDRCYINIGSSTTVSGVDRQLALKYDTSANNDSIFTFRHETKLSTSATSTDYGRLCRSVVLAIKFISPTGGGTTYSDGSDFGFDLSELNADSSAGFKWSYTADANAGNSVWNLSYRHAPLFETGKFYTSASSTTALDTQPTNWTTGWFNYYYGNSTPRTQLDEYFSTRTHWPVFTTVEQLNSNWDLSRSFLYSSGTVGSLVICGTSIADGYNSTLPTMYKAALRDYVASYSFPGFDTSDSSTLLGATGVTARSINLNVSGVFHNRQSR